MLNPAMPTQTLADSCTHRAAAGAERAAAAPAASPVAPDSAPCDEQPKYSAELMRMFAHLVVLR